MCTWYRIGFLWEDRHAGRTSSDAPNAWWGSCYGLSYQCKFHFAGIASTTNPCVSKDGVSGVIAYDDLAFQGLHTVIEKMSNVLVLTGNVDDLEAGGQQDATAAESWVAVTLIQSTPAQRFWIGFGSSSCNWLQSNSLNIAWSGSWFLIN